MKTAFNIKFRPEIEAGEFKVVTADGRPVTIQRWDMKGNYPILGYLMEKQTDYEGENTWEEERPIAFDLKGNPDGYALADNMKGQADALDKIHKEYPDAFGVIRKGLALSAKDGMYNIVSHIKTL